VTRARSELAAARRIVIKIGSRLLQEAPLGRAEMLAHECAALRAQGKEVLLVTSGAIALGVKRLNLPERPRTIPGLQATAAVGQGLLMELYQRAFSHSGLAVGQVLLTHDDVRDRRRYLNARHALAELLRLGVVPIINENDTVSVDEIKFGDNDRLAALVGTLVEADLVVLLTDVEGLHAGDPKTGAPLIHEVNDLDREAVPVAGGATAGGVGTGGMASKVEAARVAVTSGTTLVITSGRRPRPVTSIVDGELAGTVFWPKAGMLRRKHWIGYALRPEGTLVVDAGAARALVEGGKSLLAIGVRTVDGDFEAGASVRVADLAGKELARGLVALDASELRKVAGAPTSELEARLGYRPADEVIHRDDLVLV